MPIDKQIKRLFKNKLKFINKERSEHYFRDACDGELYQNLMKSRVFGKFFINNKAFTLLWNTDGVALCTKSDMSVWPIYIAILEIDLKQRFCLENIIIAGL
jgi:hypothetical protein